MNEQPADYAIVFVDVLGFSETVLTCDWTQIVELYTTLHALVQDFWGDNISHDANHTGSLLFSDCAVMWTRYSPGAAESLLALAAEFYCACLRAGILLRGAAAAGQMLIDAASGIVVGTPLVHAARAEQSQCWSGIALCRSFWVEPNAKIRHDLHIQYDLHRKQDAKHGHVLSEYVLDWRETWRLTETEAVSAFDVLSQRSRTDPHGHLQVTLEFLASSRWVGGAPDLPLDAS